MSDAMIVFILYYFWICWYRFLIQTLMK